MSRPQADVLHRAYAITETADISNVDNFVPENRNPTEQGLQRFLGGEGDGNTADAQSGQGRGEVEAESAEYEENRQNEDHNLEHALAQNDERAGAHPPRKNGALPHTSHHLSQNPPQQPIAAHHRYYAGHLLVVVPLQHWNANVRHENAVNQDAEHQPERPHKRPPRRGHGMLPIACPEIPRQPQDLNYYPCQERSDRNREQYRERLPPGKPPKLVTH